METSTRTLYYYGNPNTLRSCLAHGSLVCDAYLGDHAYEKTLGNLAEQTLFLTHLRLSPELMALGLPEGSYLYPLVLEIKVLGEADFAMPAYLLGADGQAVAGDLKAYDPREHVGAFVAGELPLSMVESFLFLNGQDKVSFYDPSPNLWFPEALFRVMEDKERKRFRETLASELVKNQGVLLDEELHAKHPGNEMIKTLCLREKHRAAALRLALSASVQLGDNKANLDSLMARLFLLDIGQLKVKGKPLPLPALRPSDADLDAVLGFQSEGAGDSNGLNRRVLAHAYHTFLSMERGAGPDAQAMWADVTALALSVGTPELDREAGMRLRGALLAAKEYFNGAMDTPLREVLAGIPGNLPALSGLLMVLKNCDESRIRYFEEDLSRFRLSPGTRRYAWVYYAALNGLNPFDGVWKGDLWLNRFCDAYAVQKAPHKELISGVYAFGQYKSFAGKKLGKAQTPGNPAGYPLNLKPLVEMEELRLRLLAAVNNPMERALVFEFLQGRFKTLAKAYTGVEYQVEVKHQIKPEHDGETVLRFTKEPIKVEVFLAKAFAREWLADQAIFAGKMKTAANKKAALSTFARLMGDEP